MTAPIIPPSPTDDEYRRAGEAAPDDPAFFALAEPFTLFGAWFEDARTKEVNDANAVALATVDPDGLPDVRMVLLKDFSPAGFTFYSNAQSAKGRELAANPKAALCFHWKSLRRQVRIRGPVSFVSDEEADAYFATRARNSQIGAWASLQSQALEGRAPLERRIAEYALRFGIGKVPRPEHWRGWRLAPLSIEFWRDRPFRLHDRLVFTRQSLSEAWAKHRLYP